MLTLTQFFGPLVKEVGARFYLPGARQNSRTAGGEVLSAVMGNSLWHGEVSAVAQGRQAVETLQAQFEYIDQTGESFLVHPRLCSPAADPGGSKLASAAPTIYALPSDAFKIRLDNLPDGYTLKRGDFLSFQYGTDPTRYALHRVYSSSVSADSAGRTPQITVVPHIRPGAVVGAAVTLIKPVCKAVIVPGSISWPGNSSLERVSFEFIQTLR